jgi:hypothetical protein
MDEVRRSGDRPLMITEIRAWLTVAIAFTAQLVAIVYWAASLSSDLKSVNQRLSDYQTLTTQKYPASEAEKEFALIKRTLDDHESRLRRQEDTQFRRR